MTRLFHSQLPSDSQLPEKNLLARLHKLRANPEDELNRFIEQFYKGDKQEDFYHQKACRALEDLVKSSKLLDTASEDEQDTEIYRLARNVGFENFSERTKGKRYHPTSFVRDGSLYEEGEFYQEAFTRLLKHFDKNPRAIKEKGLDGYFNIIVKNVQNDIGRESKIKSKEYVKIEYLGAKADQEEKPYDYIEEARDYIEEFIDESSVRELLTRIEAQDKNGKKRKLLKRIFLFDESRKQIADSEGESVNSVSARLRRVFVVFLLLLTPGELRAYLRVHAATRERMQRLIEDIAQSRWEPYESMMVRMYVIEGKEQPAIIADIKVFAKQHEKQLTKRLHTCLKELFEAFCTLRRNKSSESEDAVSEDAVSEDAINEQDEMLDELELVSDDLDEMPDDAQGSWDDLDEPDDVQGSWDDILDESEGSTSNE